MDKARDFHNHEHVFYDGTNYPALLPQNDTGFQKLQKEQLEKAKSSTNPLYFDLNWILLQGLICQRDATYDRKQDDLDKVADYLFKTKKNGPCMS